jgi:hypothetical protein
MRPKMTLVLMLLAAWCGQAGVAPAQFVMPSAAPTIPTGPVGIAAPAVPTIPSTSFTRPLGTGPSVVPGNLSLPTVPGPVARPAPAAPAVSQPYRFSVSPSPAGGSRGSSGGGTYSTPTTPSYTPPAASPSRIDVPQSPPPVKIAPPKVEGGKPGFGGSGSAGGPGGPGGEPTGKAPVVKAWYEDVPGWVWFVGS